jgi:hypothetical protein
MVVASIGYLDSIFLLVCVSACHGHHQSHSISDLHNFPFLGRMPQGGTNGVVRKPRKANLVQRNSLPSKSLVLYLTSYIQRTLPMSSHT